VNLLVVFAVDVIAVVVEQCKLAVAGEAAVGDDLNGVN
jgi:hypothetical protein